MCTLTHSYKGNIRSHGLQIENFVNHFIFKNVNFKDVLIKGFIRLHTFIYHCCFITSLFGTLEFVNWSIPFFYFLFLFLLISY